MQILGVRKIVLWTDLYVARGMDTVFAVLLQSYCCFFFFFLNDPAPPEIYTFPPPAALPISLESFQSAAEPQSRPRTRSPGGLQLGPAVRQASRPPRQSSPTAPVSARLDTLAEIEFRSRSEEHTSELQSPCNLVCRLLLEKKK